VGLGATSAASLAGLADLVVVDTRREGAEVVLAVLVRNRTPQRLHGVDAAGARHIRLSAWTEGVRASVPLPPLLAPRASALVHVRLPAAPHAPVHLGLALDGLGPAPAAAETTAP